MRVRIYTDGGARGNPGPAGIGVSICSMKDGVETEIATVSEYMGHATNNQAEYTAIFRGLEHVKELGAKEVEVVMDSELATKQLNGEYKVKNQELAKIFLKVWNLRQQFEHVTFRHVPRAQNKRADELVNKAIDEALG